MRHTQKRIVLPEAESNNALKEADKTGQPSLSVKKNYSIYREPAARLKLKIILTSALLIN
jgi:hypothetical protein